ncbi:Beta-1,4-glucuronyltransferase 1 [Hypsibius exemplaris]|uniref:Beta-1,4-glucuronyltransferase 1 n=1 Tax=Hypsibius exemplaris TaxID=2072580 RepID=A0A9X6NJ18_HYPEX|nr:Beta-1,4-glucuronyltransferase 1 [Hypsibius exemplaris]
MRFFLWLRLGSRNYLSASVFLLFVFLFFIWKLRTSRSSHVTLRTPNSQLSSFLNGKNTADFILDASGKYRIYPFGFRKNIDNRAKSGVTVKVSLVSHCTTEHLTLLPALARRWQGPISMAVYSSPSDLEDTIRRFELLRQCNPDVEQLVDAHFVTLLTPGDRRPASSVALDVDNQQQPSVEERFLRCDDLFESRLKAKLKDSPNYDQSSPYPNNLLRNIGRTFSNSEYVLVVDIDQTPNVGLHNAFISFIKARRRISSITEDTVEREVFVVPAFEINTATSVATPGTKTELLGLLRQFIVRPFYFEMCWKCHQPTGYQKWENCPVSNDMTVSHQVEWIDPWEPFFFTPNKAPMYDERFMQYGFNRISHACELHIAGYNFSVLSNAFLVHNGFKTAETFHKSKQTELTRNRALFAVFKKELLEVYPESSRRCW